MASDVKDTFPTLPAKHWWMLKERFLKSIPSAVTPSFLETVLGMKASSARTNVIPSLNQLGIIDSTGKPTERANLWRHDDTYAQVCKEIFNEVYPNEIREASVGTDLDRAAIEKWFMRKTGGGEGLARKMAIMFSILAEADPSKRDVGKSNNGKSTGRAKEKSIPKEKRLPKPSTLSAAAQKPIASVTSAESHVEKFSPSIHIDLQIHISPESSPEQINKIFESMSKHLFKMKHE